MLMLLLTELVRVNENDLVQLNVPETVIRRCFYRFQSQIKL